MVDRRFEAMACRWRKYRIESWLECKLPAQAFMAELHHALVCRLLHGRRATKVLQGGRVRAIVALLCLSATSDHEGGPEPLAPRLDQD